MIAAALVFELIRRGMIEESITRRPLDAAHAELGIDHGLRVDPHLAAADRVVVGLAEAARVGLELGARPDLGPGQMLAPDVGAERGLGHDLAGELEAAQRHLEVVGLGPVVRVDHGRRSSGRRCAAGRCRGSSAADGRS